ncbi:hypothetical protein ACXYMX_07270 [Sporosarcina sp. CAU 1771]
MNEHPWRLAIGGWVSFVATAILYLLFDYNTSLVLSFLTAAIILTILNAVYVLYTKRKSKEE